MPGCNQEDFGNLIPFLQWTSLSALKASVLLSSCYTMQILFILSRNDIAREAAGRSQRVTCPLCHLSCNVFGLATIGPRIAQSKLVLYCAIWIATCRNVGKINHCTLQKSCHTLLSRAATWNGFKTVQAILAKSKTELHFVQSCRPKNVARQFAKRACYTLQLVSQRHCSTSCKENCTVLHCCRARFYLLQQLRRFFQTVASCSKRLEHVF